jgi:hypothetical protein
LVSEGAYERLDFLYNYVAHDIDVNISGIIRTDVINIQASREMAGRFSVGVLSKRLDDAINDLSSELN